jgi:hypothetical protein
MMMMTGVGDSTNLRSRSLIPQSNDTSPAAPILHREYSA